MKYIRTIDDKIIKIDENGCIKEFNNKLYAFRDKTFSYRFENGREVVKEADTIEELCDEFVYIKDGIARQYLTIDFKFKNDDEYCSLRNRLTANGIAEMSKGISKYELQVGELKGAIWTDKGLIYVAKMNEKGVLELI